MFKRILTFFVLILLNILTLSGQNDTISKPAVKTEKSKDLFCLFGSEDLMNISIRFDLTDYLRRKDKGKSISALLTFNPGMADSVEKSISINTRGFFRLEHCYFPPMEISFKKPVNAYPDSGKIKKLKLVSTCEFSSKGDEYVLREYLVYKMFNSITDSSFRVRLLKVTFIDTKRNRRPVIQYGFFIEPKSILATRINSVQIKNKNLTQKYIDPRVMDIVSIFNYMVGDWDWAVQSLHNILILKSLKYSTSSLGIAVPYDFDLTGVVDPGYNMPPPESGLQSNRDRKYAGICRSRDVYFDELRWFLGEKEKIYAVVNNFPYLDQRAKKDIITYLDSFFSQLERPRSMENLLGDLLNNCIKL